MKRELEEFADRHSLSPRERDVLVLLANRVVNFKEIASHLKLSPSTVNNHFKNIFEKTKTNSKSELLAAVLAGVHKKYDHCRHLVKKPQVLIVDDEQEICEALSKGLSLKGVKVHAFSDPLKAIESIGDLKIDLIISDIRMPKMTGIELLQELRRVHRYFPALVFLTGYHQKHSLEQVMNMGAAAILEKPIDLDRLFQVIMEHFIEDGEERDLYLGLGEVVAPRVQSPLRLGVGQVGYGGVFIPLPSNLAPILEEDIEPGMALTIDFTLQDTDAPASDRKITATCEVVWKRPAPSEGLQSGFGARFLRITEADRAAVHEYVRQNRILSFIPIGSAN